MSVNLKEYFDDLSKDLGWLDYYLINKVEDDKIFVIFYTKYKISPEDPEFDVLISRCIDIEEALGKEVVWNYKSVNHFPLFKLIRRFRKCQKEQKFKL